MSLDISTRRVKDEMSKVVIAVRPENSVEYAQDQMERFRLTALPVTDQDGRCVGILSAADVVVRTGHRTTVGDLMSEPVEVVDPELPLVEATREMLEYRVHHLPVVGQDKQLVGVISTMDLLAAFFKCHNG